VKKGRLGLPGIPNIANFVFPSEDKKSCHVLTLLADGRQIYVKEAVSYGETVRETNEDGKTIEDPEVGRILVELVRKYFPGGVKRLRDYENFLKTLRGKR
jgi:hypothetical protein